ncbi:hypothetical protein ILYODFUR_020162, partial [Ilyodon furcidens]
ARASTGPRSRRDARRCAAAAARPALAATPSLSPSRSPSGTRAAVRDRLPVRASCISCTRSISNTKGLGAAGGQGLPQRRSEGRAAFSNKGYLTEKQSVTLCLLSTVALTDTGGRQSLLSQHYPSLSRHTSSPKTAHVLLSSTHVHSRAPSLIQGVRFAMAMDATETNHDVLLEVTEPRGP